VRPSRAIEKGGGFFVPGLEGGKIRVVSGLFLFLLYAINRPAAVDFNVIDVPETISQIIGLVAICLLFAQGIVELIPTQSPTIAQSTNSFLSILQSAADEDTLLTGRADAVARSIIKTCAHVNYIAVLVDPQSGINSSSNILYEIGPISGDINPTILGNATFAQLKEYCNGQSGFATFRANSPVGNEVRAAFAGIPSNTREISIAEDHKAMIWIIASSNDESDSLSNISKTWIQSLLATP